MQYYKSILFLPNFFSFFQSYFIGTELVTSSPASRKKGNILLSPSSGEAETNRSNGCIFEKMPENG
jgi:hypothetical protein